MHLTQALPYQRSYVCSEVQKHPRSKSRSQVQRPSALRYERGALNLDIESTPEAASGGQSWGWNRDWLVFFRKSTDVPCRIITEFRCFGMAVAIESLGAKGTNTSA